MTSFAPQTAMDGQMTSAEFERWLALQLAIGWTVRNPAEVENIRAKFRAGATVAPFREVPQKELEAA